MPQEWSDLFILADAAGDRSAEAPPAKRVGLVRRLRQSMSRTRQALGSEIHATLFGALDDHTWERLEEALIVADVGAATTASVVGTLEAEAQAGRISGGEALSERLVELLADAAAVGDARIDIRATPTVIMAVGVNGTGKTTTIGKLAWALRNELGRSVLLAAADTFRAAASEQLQGWGQRAGCEVRVGMTRRACEFVTPLTFRALSGAHVLVDDYKSGVGYLVHATPRALARMTVAENVLLATPRHPGEHLGRLGRAREREAQARAAELLALVGLEKHARALAGTLSGGQRKLLDLIRALMAEPRLLLLDEPMAGVSPTLRVELLQHIRDLRDRDGITLVIVEHDLEFVMGVSDRMVVMNDGRVIADGTPEEIRGDERVIDAYLGARHEAA